ncbi:MAG: PH domain-containing protein [Bacillota bacterium]|jgi:uncharacterized membrane protein
MSIILISVFITIAGVFFASLQMAASPKNNVILNTTLPREVRKDSRVLEIVKGFKKANFLVFLASLVPTPLLFFIQMPSLMILFLTAWVTALVLASNWLVRIYSGRLSALKRENQWFVGNTQTITVDLEVTKAKARMAVSRLWFLPSLAAALVFLVLGFLDKVNLFLGAAAVSGVMVYYLLYISTTRERARAYSEDTEVNMAVTRISIRLWSICWTALAALHVLHMLMMHLAIENHDEILGTAGVISMLFFGLLAIFLTHSKIRSSQDRLLAGSQSAICVDEDYYWQGAFYNNPNDSRVLVDKRIGIGQTVNLGTRAGKIFYYGSIIGLPVFMLALFLFFLSLDSANFELTISDNQVEIHAPLYGYEFPLSDIQSITMVDTVPGGSRTNGAATSQYRLGNFSLKGYGRSKLYVYNGQPQYILLELPDLNIFFSARTPEKTQQYYELLLESLD